MSNTCEFCASKPYKYSYQVAETGRCSKCGQIAECWDFELIAFYKVFGLSNELIWSKLPRLRNDGIHSETTNSLENIGLTLKELI